MEPMMIFYFGAFVGAMTFMAAVHTITVKQLPIMMEEAYRQAKKEDAENDKDQEESFQREKGFY